MYNSRHSDREGTINHFAIVNVMDKLTIRRKTATHNCLVNYLSIVLAVSFLISIALPTSNNRAFHNTYASEPKEGSAI
jgi:hypothetical protein